MKRDMMLISRTCFLFVVFFSPQPKERLFNFVLSGAAKTICKCISSSKFLLFLSVRSKHCIEKLSFILLPFSNSFPDCLVLPGGPAQNNQQVHLPSFLEQQNTWETFQSGSRDPDNDQLLAIIRRSGCRHLPRLTGHNLGLDMENLSTGSEGFFGPLA
jgi:uncharacterized SAM-binding protein YcdF (DUF218 family)